MCMTRINSGASHSQHHTTSQNTTQHLKTLHNISKHHITSHNVSQHLRTYGPNIASLQKSSKSSMVKLDVKSCQWVNYDVKIRHNMISYDIMWYHIIWYHIIWYHNMRLTCRSSKVKKVDRTWKFVVFWDDIAHCREHCHPAVLDLNCSASSECGCICVGVQSEGIPVTDGCLHTKVSGGDGCWRRGSRRRLGATKGSGAHSSINGSSTSLEQHILRGCTERRISVVGPIAPCRSGQTSGQLTSTRTLHSEPQRITKAR